MNASQDRPPHRKPGHARAPWTSDREGLQDRQRAAPVPVEGETATGASPPAGDALTLPGGALVAMRKSGGLLFRSWEVVVSDEGRVETSALGGGRPARTAAGPALGATELASLRRAVERIAVERLPARAAQRPDGFIYEIAARTRGGLRVVEVADSHVPEALKPLIRQLNTLLPTER